MTRFLQHDSKVFIGIYTARKYCFFARTAIIKSGPTGCIPFLTTPPICAFLSPEPRNSPKTESQPDSVAFFVPSAHVQVEVHPTVILGRE